MLKPLLSLRLVRTPLTMFDKICTTHLDSTSPRERFQCHSAGCRRPADLGEMQDPAMQSWELYSIWAVDEVDLESRLLACRSPATSLYVLQGNCRVRDKGVPSCCVIPMQDYQPTLHPEVL